MLNDNIQIMTKMKNLNQSRPAFPGSNKNLLNISYPFYNIFTIGSQVKVQLCISNKLIILKLIIAELSLLLLIRFGRLHVSVSGQIHIMLMSCSSKCQIKIDATLLVLTLSPTTRLFLLSYWIKLWTREKHMSTFQSRIERLSHMPKILYCIRMGKHVQINNQTHHIM